MILWYRDFLFASWVAYLLEINFLLSSRNFTKIWPHYRTWSLCIADVFSRDPSFELNSPRPHPPQQAPVSSCTPDFPCVSVSELLLLLDEVWACDLRARMYSCSPSVSPVVSQQSALGLDGDGKDKGELLRPWYGWHGMAWHLQHEKGKLEKLPRCNIHGR